MGIIKIGFSKKKKKLPFYETSDISSAYSFVSRHMVRRAGYFSFPYTSALFPPLPRVLKSLVQDYSNGFLTSFQAPLPLQSVHALQRTNPDWLDLHGSKSLKPHGK